MTEEFKAYRLQLIAEAVEKVNEERKRKSFSEEFKLEEQEYE